MEGKNKLGELFHNEFIRSLAGWFTVCLVVIGMLKFIIQFYAGNEISITLSLAEILIASSIASAVLSVLAFAKAKKTRRNIKILADLIPSLKERTSDLNNRLKTIEDIEGKRFKLK